MNPAGDAAAAEEAPGRGASSAAAASGGRGLLCGGGEGEGWLAMEAEGLGFRTFGWSETKRGCAWPWRSLSHLTHPPPTGAQLR